MRSNIIAVYCCPNPECNNYYGTSEMGRLEEIWNTDLKGKPTSPRSRCPACGSQRVRRFAHLTPEDLRDIPNSSQA
jgi:hypothetical protein